MATENCTFSPALDLQLRLGLRPCRSMKRRRIDVSEEVTPHSPISKLGDDVLAEVLIRAPEPGSAWRCKAVCKRWNSLISDTHFVRRYVSHHQQSSSNQYGGGELEEPPLMSSNSGESILSFLPLPDGLAYEPLYFRVFDCYKDLVLCGFHEGSEIRDEFCRSLFVCNPFTKQWIALPLAPETPSPAIGLKEARLVCEPRSCSSNVKLDVGEGRPPFVFSSAYRFRVVCIYQLNKRIRIDVFCSESGEWMKEPLVLEGHFRWSDINVVSTSCNGGLFWLCMNSGLDWLNPFVIAGFNPFRLDIPPILFDAPQLGEGNWNMSVSQGALHLISREPSARPAVLSVWRLEEDCKTWSVQHKTLLERTLSRYDYELEDCNIVSLHPEKPHIAFFEHPGVYGRLDSVIVSYNMKTGELEFFDQFVPRFQPRVSCWPTPIPRYEKLRGIYDGSHGCWVQQSSSEAATLSINDCVQG
ncbi:unnamed protein product [Linum trigynum]|uniref:F-box protein At3g26010-like beta-propeller domain-containing protein n=1 Tax=Linum trigynum TaxID=586398 RepID=A0AAV2CTQ8_9ROSI